MYIFLDFPFSTAPPSYSCFICLLLPMDHVTDTIASRSLLARLVTCARLWVTMHATTTWTTRLQRLVRSSSCTTTCRVYTPFLSVLFLIIAHFTHCTSPSVPHIASCFRTCFVALDRKCCASLHLSTPTTHTYFTYSLARFLFQQPNISPLVFMLGALGVQYYCTTIEMAP